MVERVEFPARCIALRCPIALSADDFEGFDIAPTKNCSGPQLTSGDPPDLVEVFADGRPAVVQKAAGQTGPLVCQNTGMNLWLDAQINRNELEQ
jgi:hypothetical protein